MVVSEQQYQLELVIMIVAVFCVGLGFTLPFCCAACGAYKAKANERREIALTARGQTQGPTSTVLEMPQDDNWYEEVTNTGDPTLRLTRV